MKRRACLALLAAAAAGLRPLAAAGAAPDPADWAVWKAAFLSPEGRVIDHLQGDASHSEGQGYSLLLAEWFGDAEAFARIFRWTEAHLAVRQDPLLAWKWRPGPAPNIADYNNASDGDLFYAWALARAALRFSVPRYGVRAKAMARFLAMSCLRADPGSPNRLVLLPAAEGFHDEESLTINPSYIMPLAMKELGRRTWTEPLIQAASDGEALLADIAEVGLIPDWITLTPRGWATSVRHANVSGYEALRCPLFLIWSGAVAHPVVLSMAAQYSTHAKSDESPVVFDLSDSTLTASSGYPGYAAVAALSMCRDTLPAFSANQPYYPATLHLFSKIAAHVGRSHPAQC